MGKTETEFRCYPCSEPPYQKTEEPPLREIREISIGARIEEIRKLVRKVRSLDYFVNPGTSKTVGYTVNIEVGMLLTPERQGGLMGRLDKLQKRKTLDITKEQKKEGIRYIIHFPREDTSKLELFEKCLETYFD